MTAWRFPRPRARHAAEHRTGSWYGASKRAAPRQPSRQNHICSGPVETASERSRPQTPNKHEKEALTTINTPSHRCRPGLRSTPSKEETRTVQIPNVLCDERSRRGARDEAEDSTLLHATRPLGGLLLLVFGEFAANYRCDCRVHVL